MKIYENLYYSSDFKQCLGPVDKNIKTIEKFHEDTEKILPGSFKGCVNLDSVSFKNLKTDNLEIEDRAFEGCKYLKNVDFPTSIALLGKNAFKDCVHLKTVYLPEYIDIVRQDVFENCQILDLFLPKRIGGRNHKYLDKCFVNCTTVTGAFYADTLFHTANFDSTSNAFKSVKGILFDAHGNLMRYPSARKKFLLPTSSIFCVRNNAFLGCKLDDVEIEGVKIDSYAFCYCDIKNLSLRNSIFHDASHIFASSNIENLTLENCVKEENSEFIGNATIKNIKAYGGDFEVKNNNLIYKNMLLYNFEKENTAIVPENVTVIEPFSFSHTMAKNIVFSEEKTRTFLLKFCFSNNNFIENIFFNGEVDLGTLAFSHLDNLKALYLPKKAINYIGSFDDCNLKQIYLAPDSIVDEKKTFFYNDVTPKKIEVIEDAKKASINPLNYLDVLDSFKEINEYAKSI